MKIRTFAVAALLFLSALAAVAEPAPAVLTNDGVVYTVSRLPASRLELIRREGDRRVSVLVPAPADAGTVTEARLAFDSNSATLFVVWHSGDSVYVARRTNEGPWAEPLLLDLGAKRAGLEIVLSRAGETTLLHAAWWKIGAEPVAEYALLAFEEGEHVSSFVSDLNSLVGSNSITDYSADNEPMTAVVHPPLAMARAGAGVDIVFGSSTSTRLTRIILDPKVRADARLWKPSRKGGGQTPRSGLMSVSGDPVKAIVSQGRIILYTPDTNFRFVILEKGRWSPERMIQLDENLTREQLVEELRKTVEQLEIEETPEDTVNE